MEIKAVFTRLKKDSIMRPKPSWWFHLWSGRNTAGDVKWWGFILVGFHLEVEIK